MGNPSDAYFGKTIGVTVRNFSAKVSLRESAELAIIPSSDDRPKYGSVRDLLREVDLRGYHGGVPLMKATIKRFVGYCNEHGIDLHDKNFSIEYQTTIPQRVGLSGSSALVIAALRCLMQFYGVEIEKPLLPSAAEAMPSVSRIVGARSMLATNASLVPIGTTPSQAMISGTLTQGCLMLEPWPNQ